MSTFTIIQGMRVTTMYNNTIRDTVMHALKNNINLQDGIVITLLQFYEFPPQVFHTQVHVIDTINVLSNENKFIIVDNGN